MCVVVFFFCRVDSWTNANLTQNICYLPAKYQNKIQVVALISHIHTYKRKRAVARELQWYKVANENIRRICNNNWIYLFQFTAKHNVPFSEHNFTSIKVQFNNFIPFFSFIRSFICFFFVSFYFCCAEFFFIVPSAVPAISRCSLSLCGSFDGTEKRIHLVCFFRVYIQFHHTIA